MDKLKPALPVPQGVQNGQVDGLKASAGWPIGPYHPDLEARLALELLEGPFAGESRQTAAHAARRLLAGAPVVVRSPSYHCDRGRVDMEPGLVLLPKRPVALT